jgi:hypothetical protein
MSDQFAPSDDSMAALSPSQRREVAGAYSKLLRNDTLTREEQATLKRFENDREERLRWQYYRSIPKKHWRKMSGRQAKVINEQAARYKLPLDGPTIDLEAFVEAFHDFLSRNAQRLAQDDDALMRSAQTSPALERYREERALLAELDRLERTRQLLPLDYVQQAHDRMAMLIRRAIERLDIRFGNDAGDIMRDTLDDYEREIDEMFGDDEEVDADPL